MTPDDAELERLVRGFLRHAVRMGLDIAHDERDVSGIMRNVRIYRGPAIPWRQGDAAAHSIEAVIAAWNAWWAGWEAGRNEARRPA